MYIQFTLKPIPPFRLDYTVWALRRQQSNIIDQWENNRYTRILLYRDKPIKITVYQKGTVIIPKLTIEAESKYLPYFPKSRIMVTLKKILGLNLNLNKFYQIVNHDEDLQELTYQFIGLKPPCFPTVFETAINAIACQQVTLDVSITLLNRLAQHYGVAYHNKHKTLYAFPTPKILSQLNQGDLHKLGFSRQKAKTIINLAIAVTNHQIQLEELENGNLVDIYKYLYQISGIDRWSSEYILLRGLRRLNVFPGDDVGTQKKLQEYFHLDNKINYEKVKKLTYRWQPYAGFIYYYLLLTKIFKKPLVRTKEYLYYEMSSSSSV